ncbi:MAG: hypothetical protein IH991_00175 [Planctomycetes bacterium]|nr:hypothetical protein [Planctomycetota bacterium]
MRDQRASLSDAAGQLYIDWHEIRSLATPGARDRRPAGQWLALDNFRFAKGNE